MTEALKVSPAPRVSTSASGGKASEWTTTPSGPKASAPFSAQAQISTALMGKEAHHSSGTSSWPYRVEELHNSAALLTPGGHFYNVLVATHHKI